MRRPGGLRRAAITSAAGALIWCATTPAAVAHPFGDPQSAEISVTPQGLRITWNAAVDDLGLLAAWIGASDGTGSLMVFEDGEFLEDESTELPGAQLARAPQLADYLLDRIEVSAAGEVCAGELLHVDDVETSGATLDFDCGGPVPAADVRIATLTDIDDTYRILAAGPHGQGHLYSTVAAVHRWVLRDAPVTSSPGAGAAETTAPAARPESRAHSAMTQLGSIGVGVVVAVGVALHVARRRRSRT